MEFFGSITHAKFAHAGIVITGTAIDFDSGKFFINVFVRVWCRNFVSILKPEKKS